MLHYPTVIDCEFGFSNRAAAEITAMYPHRLFLALV